MSAANNLVKEFCQSIGMAALGFDEENQRSLSFDEKIVVTFLGDSADSEMLTALAFVADTNLNLEVLKKLLEQNFLPEAHGGARFALEPKTSRTVLSRQWHAGRTPVAEFSADLEAFVNSAMQAQAFVEENANSAPAPVATEGAPGIDPLAAAYQTL
jgi:hypothetical protein